MVTFGESLREGAQAATCSLLASVEAASWVGGSLDLSDSPNTFAEAVRQARLYACSNPDPLVEVPSPPFSGGQCEGVEYDVLIRRNSYTQRRCDNGNTSVIDVNNTTTLRVYGPVRGLRTQELSQGDCGASNVRTFLDAFDSSGEPLALTVWSVVVNGGFFAVDSLDIEILTVSRVDGAPDACGDPTSPPIPPYSPVTINRDITYIDNSDTEITEEGDFTILAPVFIGGAIIAPITVDVGGVTIPLDFNLSTGDISLKFDFSDSPPRFSDEDPVDNPTADEPEVEEDALFYGLIVYSTPDGPGRVSSTLVAQEDAPALYLPRTGNVWFQVPVGDRVSWVGPVPIQAENQTVMVPFGLAASGYRVVPSSGWSLEAAKIGKPPCGCNSE